MSEAVILLIPNHEAAIKRKATLSTLSRILRYTVVRLIVLFLTVVLLYT